MLPSAVLGYLSWRATQNEKSYSLERLRASYRQLAILSARQMDYQLSSLESRWIGEFDQLIGTSPGGPTAERVHEFEGRQPLIAHYFLLGAPGRVVYPADLRSDGSVSPDAGGPAPHAPNTNRSRGWSRGARTSVRHRDLKAAIAAYREIPGRVKPHCGRWQSHVAGRS
jgi:hypothetical protein